ncbi:MAG: hypothetical protein H3C26_00040 [Rhodocyclaceae bacterium]|nr:hypothetical protein [Rhodocyclaceae bacterium]
MTRLSATQRLTVASRAEVEIMRYRHDHALWHRHVHGVTLDPMQILKCIEMDQHPNTIDVSCRRTGKTAIKEMYCLKHLATTPAQEEGIVAPRLQQSQTNLTYHTEAIRRSDILSAYVGYRNGRKQLKDTGYAFENGSKCGAYGIMSQIDGDSITVASLEETDDMPQDRLLSRFLPMLGAQRRLGVDADARTFKPQIRMTGVFKGADVVQGLIDSGEYHLLPAVDVYLGVELGILNAAWAESMRQQQTEGEWIRQFLCRNVASQNWIWEKYIRKALAVGLQAMLAPAGPLPGAKYRKRGLISFGYDHSGHGESATASKSALVVAEQIGNFCTFPFVRTWPAGTDDRVIERDLLGLWEFFMPDYALGDAYGLGMLTTLNDRLYTNGLTAIDRRTINEGQSTASSWPGWAFAPIRFSGMTKHSMASMLRAAFHNGQAAIAWFDEFDMRPELDDWRAFVRQLGNIKAEATKADYSSFRMADPKQGDDLFDAAMAAVWALTTRGQEDAPTVIGRRTVTREQLLGGAANDRLLTGGLGRAVA